MNNTAIKLRKFGVTDIRMFVERNINGVWEQVPEELGISDPDEEGKNTWQPIINYDLFGLLAGVRSEVFLPFTEPRDVPADLSSKVYEKYKADDADMHHPSWISLEELQDVQDTVETVSVWVDMPNYRKYKKLGKNTNRGYDYYLRNPKNVQVVSNEKMERIMNLSSFLDENDYWTNVKYQISFKEIAKDFWVDMLQAMIKLGHDPNDVRIVFWFIN